MNAIETIQKRIGVTVDGAFGPKTAKAFRDYFKLSNRQAAHFLGQCHHESAGFTVTTENLNYSEKRLLEVFPKYFNSSNVKNYAKKPSAIANRVYANRMGNGDEKSGDGWKYRGRSIIQLTGKSNYTDFSEDYKIKGLLDKPDLVATEYAFDAAKWFFNKRGLWDICDRGADATTIKAVTKIINGGYNGLDDRINLTKKYYSWLSA